MTAYTCRRCGKPATVLRPLPETGRDYAFCADHDPQEGPKT